MVARYRTTIIWVVAAFLIIRLMLSILGALVMWQGEPHSAFEGQPIFETYQYTVPDWGPLGHLLIDGWYRWDTGWYLKIAALGYAPDDGSVGFQPLYPLLIRLTASIVGGNYLLAALLISNICALAALFLFHLFISQELGSTDDARQATIALLVFPSAFFLFAGYTESLFLALTLATWLLARNNHWGWAAVTAVLVVLARVQGLVMIFPLGWTFLSLGLPNRSRSPIQEIKTVIRSSVDRIAWKKRIANWPTAGMAIIAPVMAYFGQNLYLKYVGLGSVSQAYGNWLEIVPPWIGVIRLLQKIFTIRLGLADWIDLFLLILFLILGIFAINKLKPALSLYLWATLALILMRGYSIGLLAGFMRYMLTTFPVFLIFVLAFKNKWARSATLISFMIVQCVLVWAYLNWFWVA